MRYLLDLLPGAWNWIFQVFVVVFLSLGLNFIQKRILSRLSKELEKAKNVWNQAVLRALSAPLGLLIWILGISFAAQIIEQETGAAIFAAVSPLRKIGVIGVVAWFLIRLAKAGEESIHAHYAKKGEPIDRTTADAVGKIVRASIFITAFLVALQSLGFSVSGVLAFGGIGGIAIGFAAKDLLANFFGAFVIYFDRPFKVGDWIRSPDREIEGTVEHIGWRITRIRTFDKRPLYLPNAIFCSISVENPSRMTNRRIKETIGVRYEDAAVLPQILQEIREMLQNHPEIDQTKTLMVNLNAYAPSSLDFFIYTFTRTTNWEKFHMIKEDVLLKIYAIISSHGAEVAFPTSTLHFPSQDGEGLLPKVETLLGEKSKAQG